MGCLSVITHSISWSVGRGILINVGMDPIIGLEDNYVLPRNLIAHLHCRNCVVLQQVWKMDNDGCYHWLSTEDLQFSGNLMIEWNNYIQRLKQAGVELSDRSDQLVWSKNERDGKVFAKLAYDLILENNVVLIIYHNKHINP